MSTAKLFDAPIFQFIFAFCTSLACRHCWKTLVTLALLGFDISIPYLEISQERELIEREMR